MLPYLTSEVPGIGGEIKTQPEDFQVKEIPLYSCSGSGEHWYIEIEKRNLTTFSLINLLAKQLSIPPKNIGYAGIKDAHAISQQYISLFGVQESQLSKIEISGVKILSIDRHTNKLRIGHLKGNNFAILIRNFQESQLGNVDEILQILSKKGIPNYFGVQRFGSSANTNLVGKAVLYQNPEDICQKLLGNISNADTPLLREAKELFNQGEYKQACYRWPKSFHTEKAVLNQLSKGKTPDQAIKRISRKMCVFYISAYQSALFNQSLATRIHNIDTLWTGDVAIKHPMRSAFLVEDAAKEQPRCDALQISPSGPIYGYKMLQSQGKQGEIEKQILAAENLDVSLFKKFRLKGERRSYRFMMENACQEKSEEGLWVRFYLPKGCYATVALREIMKSESLK